MTKLIFDPPPGLVIDETALADAGRWYDGINVRFWHGRPQVIGGWVSRMTGLTGIVRSIFEWHTGAGNYIAYGTDSRLYVETSGTLHNITPAALGSNEGWSLQPWGTTLMACQAYGPLYQWSNNIAVVAAKIVQAPASIIAMLVTPQRQVLAIGCNEEASGTFNSMCIRGCDIEDPTDWTTSATNNAFEDILPGSGEIRAAAMVGPYVAVWTDKALYQGLYLGNPGQTYQWDRIAENCGCRGLRAFVVVDQTAYWMTPDVQFKSWTPGAVPATVPCPILAEVQSTMSTQ